MDINSFLIEQGLRQLEMPDSVIRQFRLAHALSDIDGRGFPKELFQLSAPVIIRGLLNYGILQMKRDWVYPYWVHRQLDREGPSYVARSQNPLLINTTHRNWTALGSPHGVHEAIIDPRGLVTPLPREWSVDVWLQEGREMMFPSRAARADQLLDTKAPRLTTTLAWNGLSLELEAFVGTTKGGIDILFHRTKVLNTTAVHKTVTAYIAIRPFNPEGVAPIERLEVRSTRFLSIDGILGVVFAKNPDLMYCQNGSVGDLAHTLASPDGMKHESPRVECAQGLAQAAAGFRLDIAPRGSRSIHYSIALGTDETLRHARVKQTWVVSYEQRREVQREVWEKELRKGGTFRFAGEDDSRLFSSSMLALLQFHDNDFISPGPFLYHHFWFRDAAPMLRALDLLGHTHRTRKVLDAFPSSLTPDGFFRAPDGEWDSNGAALWILHQHYLVSRSTLWLKQWYPNIVKAANWIVRKRTQGRSNGTPANGMMPRSISAEHLGTVDQYFWDSMWSLAGLRATAALAAELGKENDARRFRNEVSQFTIDLQKAFALAEQRLGAPLIPASPSRPFDEGAIGSIASLYPLELFDRDYPNPVATLRVFTERFLDDRGFYHPLIHSGYNAYLTLQVAHSYLLLGEVETAWSIARSIFQQASQTGAFPEAIHPKTSGGAMGDGHHGWAAAEVVLFLRDCLLREKDGRLQLLSGTTPSMITQEQPIVVDQAPTTFGPVSFSLDLESPTQWVFKFSKSYFPQHAPACIEVHLPFRALRVTPVKPSHILHQQDTERGTIITLSSEVTTLFGQRTPDSDLS